MAYLSRSYLFPGSGNNTIRVGLNANHRNKNSAEILNSLLPYRKNPIGKILFPYRKKQKKTEKSSCIICGYDLKVLNHFLLDCLHLSICGVSFYFWLYYLYI